MFFHTLANGLRNLIDISQLNYCPLYSSQQLLFTVEYFPYVCYVIQGITFLKFVLFDPLYLTMLTFYDMEETLRYT